MSIFRDLLFLHGHVADPDLARALAGRSAPPAGAPPVPASAPEPAAGTPPAASRPAMPR